MATENRLATLSPEVLDFIISYLSKKDLASLAQVSRHYSLILARYLYSSWEHHGLDHSFRSLHCFLRTLIQNPDIASLVKTLDVREWGGCPRPEDYLPGRLGSDDEVDYSDDSDAMEEIDSEMENDEDEDEDEDGEEDAVESSVEDKESISSSASKKSPMPVEGRISDQEYNRDFPIIRLAAQKVGLPKAEIFDFEMDIRERKEDVLIAMLIATLPNLTTLYVVLPEDQEAVLNLVKRAVRPESVLLQRLETVYICSALRKRIAMSLVLTQLIFCTDIGIKGHREYHLNHHILSPFLDLPNPRSVYTLTVSDLLWSLNNYSREPTSNYPPRYNTVNYALEQSDFNPLVVVDSLHDFKGLESFRWSQYISCISQGRCIGPFYRRLQTALEPFKESLVNLDLDLRRRACLEGRDAGHAFNPRANANEMVPLYREPQERENGRHLVGSMKDYSRLKSLSIDSSALHGDFAWGYSHRKIADSLPESLESILLQFTVQNYNADALLIALSTTLSEDVTDLAHRAHEKVPLLKNVTIRFLYTSNEREIPTEWSPELKSVQEAFLKARIKFQVTCGNLESRNELVEMPFFKATNERRLPPGRD